MAAALVASFGASEVRFRRAHHRAHRVTPGARKAPGGHERYTPNVARLVRTPVPGVGLGRPRASVARDAPR